jgi:hypothetical protein
MLPNGLGQFAEGAKATARWPSIPPVNFSFGNLALRAGLLVKTHADSLLGQVWCIGGRDFYVVLDAPHSGSKRCRASSIARL